ncbi:NAD(P)-binding domain-containing protein [Mycolicibacterium komossense]|nr:NAD(P)-binding domain-containing protein [Mycolicibacterium komossense]
MTESAHSGPHAEALRAGVVGLGMIGGGVAVSLARRGRIPTVFDIRADASDDLDGVPSQVPTIADVARDSDVVLLAVVTADQAREVIAGEDGILSAAHPGLVVVLLSTITVEAVHELADLCERGGVAFLDARVSGGNGAADNGLTVMVGGPDEIVERARPILEDFAKVVVHCGDLGTGMITKLARNTLTYSVWAAVREAASIAKAGGVAIDRLLEVLQNSDEGTSALMMLQIQASGFQIPEDRVDSANMLAQKDLAAVQDFAGSVGIEVPITDIVRPRMRAVYRGDLPEPLPVESWRRGLEMMDRVYGPGYHQQVPTGITIPSIVHTVDQLFGNVWARPYLTLRDRRLLTFGATAMLGRPELLRTQLRGALANEEFTVEQLREIVVHMHYYGGWPNGTSVQAVVEELIAEHSSQHA